MSLLFNAHGPSGASNQHLLVISIEYGDSEWACGSVHMARPAPRRSWRMFLSLVCDRFVYADGENFVHEVLISIQVSLSLCPPVFFCQRHEALSVLCVP